jgi:catechol 2,3-dioxygenase-like lactoylglutathione lyase family enzyme
MTNMRFYKFEISGMLAPILVSTLLAGIAYTENKKPVPQSGKVLGIAFESLAVSDLEKSVNYYKAIGFAVAGEVNPPWIKDEAANRLYNTPGAMSRTATLSVTSTGSGKPFTLFLREYKDFVRHSRADFPARDPSSSHIGLMVPEADVLWAQLKSSGLLRALSWDAKLVRMPGQPSGGIAYVMDPDGFNIEIIGLSPKPPEKADGQQFPAAHSSLHHLGLVVLNSDKSKSFYGALLSAKFPDTLPGWVSGDNYDAAVGGRGYVIRLINGTFPEAAAPQTTMRFELVEYQKPTRPDVADYGYSDVAVNCVGLEVDGLDALHARLKAAGIQTWSGKGVVKKKDGTRAVVVRDPDVGAFVELFERK